MLSLLIFDPSVVVGCLFVVLVAVRWFAVPRDTRRSEYLLLAALFALIVSPMAQAAADSLTRVRPMKMDLYAYVADNALGQPAFVLGRIAAPHPWVKVLLNVAYGLLPIGVLLTLSWHILRRSAGVSRMVWAFALNLVVAPAIYLLVPVCGPQFAFPNFPLDPGQVIPHMIGIDAAPNGIPSVHTSTALLIVWFSRKTRVGLSAAIVYLLLIAAACLASGQHYAIDLLIAIPYTALVLWLSKLRWFRSVATSMQSSDRAVDEKVTFRL